MQATISVAESDAATEDTAAGSTTIMSMEAIVAELNAHSTDGARDVIKAAQTILKGDQADIRKLCKPWGVLAKCQNRRLDMATIKKELKMALTKRAMELKSATEASVRCATTDQAETAVRADVALAGINNYPNLFVSPDPDLSDALAWAHGNAMEPCVAAWRSKCGEWDSAVATKEHELRQKRRKLCKEHGIPCTRAVDAGQELETTMEYIRQQLTNQIQEIRQQPGAQSGTDASVGGAAAEHAEATIRADDALAETLAARSTASEHASAEFCVESAMAEAVLRITGICGDSEILVRIVDHACHSEQCVSHRVVAMCREAKWKISKELCNDQPLDACGYIAADAVCRLREAALAELNGWHRMKLPDYSDLECIHRGNQVLRKRDLDRILDSDQVNRLVRHYAYLDQRSQAEEEWWAGAVALDHFLIGLPGMVDELAATS